MFENKVLKGALLVGLGAISYGMLATFVKMAYVDGFTTVEITSSQFILGIIGMIIIYLFQSKKKKGLVEKLSKKNIYSLLLAGTPLGLTSVFYYLSVRYIPVSIGIVLLMQTVWMGVLLEMILTKKIPSFQKTTAVFMVLLGTVLATNLMNANAVIDWRGIIWGLLAAASFTTTIYSASRVAKSISTVERSLYMLLGGGVVVLCFAILTQTSSFNYDIFLKWGLLLSLFGTIIPPIFMNAGFPYTGIGLGSIVSALELPVSVAMAYFLLNEKVVFMQWIGIGLIILAIVLMNSNLNGSQNEKLQ